MYKSKLYIYKFAYVCVGGEINFQEKKLHARSCDQISYCVVNVWYFTNRMHFYTEIKKGLSVINLYAVAFFSSRLFYYVNDETEMNMKSIAVNA